MTEYEMEVNKSTNGLSLSHSSCVSLWGLWFSCGCSGIHNKLSHNLIHVCGLHHMLFAWLHQRGRKEKAGKVSARQRLEKNKEGLHVMYLKTVLNTKYCLPGSQKCGSGRSSASIRLTIGLVTAIKAETTTTINPRRRCFHCGTPTAQPCVMTCSPTGETRVNLSSNAQKGKYVKMFRIDQHKD